ncbi:MAG TPA: ArsR family transcriptional regulator [Euzebyales bacterium]|nr:ArsR family transcriptional regulator [Euzebyales bacterium]
MHRALADETRARLMRMLRTAEHPPDVHQLAEQLDLHVTTVRAHLDVLIDAGLITSQTESRVTPGRPRRLYRAVSDGPSVADTGGYRLLAEMLVGHLAATSGDVVRDAIAVGRAWGSYLVKRPPPSHATSGARARVEILALLDGLGFQPRFDEPGDRILLRRCPFLDVARDHQDVVCSVHLGIIRGALEALGAPLQATGLEPFVQPSLCVAHLAEPSRALDSTPL